MQTGINVRTNGSTSRSGARRADSSALRRPREAVRDRPRRTMITRNTAAMANNVSQTTQFHRLDGGRPSGNSRSRSVATGTITGSHMGPLSAAATPAPGSEPGFVRGRTSRSRPRPSRPARQSDPEQHPGDGVPGLPPSHDEARDREHQQRQVDHEAAPTPVRPFDPFMASMTQPRLHRHPGDERGDRPAPPPAVPAASPPSRPDGHGRRRPLRTRPVPGAHCARPRRSTRRPTPAAPRTTPSWTARGRARRGRARRAAARRTRRAPVRRRTGGG